MVSDMNIVEALRSVRLGLLEYIQERVFVGFDGICWIPVYFTYRKRRHVIKTILGCFRTRPNCYTNAFLVKTEDKEVYFLYFHFGGINPENPSGSGCWVLGFRVLGDRELMFLYREDRKMLVNMTPKRVIDFHGHLCPELVIGSKICEYAQQFLPGRSFCVVAENCTSAVDAIQVLLGVTFGNQRLKVVDFGKHVYTFLWRSDKGIKLSLKNLSYGAEDEYRELSRKIISSKATFDDMVDYQRLLDKRVMFLLQLNVKDMFHLEEVKCEHIFTELPALYNTCHDCHQKVLVDRGIEYHGSFYCIPCFKRKSTEATLRNIQ